MTPHLPGRYYRIGHVGLISGRSPALDMLGDAARADVDEASRCIFGVDIGQVDRVKQEAVIRFCLRMKHAGVTSAIGIDECARRLNELSGS